MQIAELTKAKVDSEAAKVAEAEAAVKRNADEQRVKAAKKKEADARRADKAAIQKTARSAAKSVPVVKARPQKTDLFSTSYKKCKDLSKSKNVQITAMVGSLAVVIGTVLSFSYGV